MHLWGKMAVQHTQSNQSNTPQLSGLAGAMRPHFFSASSKTSLPSHTPVYSGSSSLSALLSGKHAAIGASSYPTSPIIHGKVLANSSSKEREQQQKEKEHQHAMLAAMASQTIFKKLGSAFWDAFTGSGSSSSSAGVASNSAGAQQGAWDADKVKKVLEGKAVLKVVDVEPAPSSSAISPVKTTMREKTMGPSPLVQDDWKKCSTSVCDILEESMRSLTLSKKI